MATENKNLPNIPPDAVAAVIDGLASKTGITEAAVIAILAPIVPYALTLAGISLPAPVISLIISILAGGFIFWQRRSQKNKVQAAVQATVEGESSTTQPCTAPTAATATPIPNPFNQEPKD